MASPFQDFIPDGGELNGQGSGFKDFVPTPAHVEPVAKVAHVKTLAELKTEAESLGLSLKGLTTIKKLQAAIDEANAKEVAPPVDTGEPEEPLPVAPEPVASTPEEPVAPEEPKTPPTE